MNNTAYVRILTGPKKGGVYVLSNLQVFELGRADTCHVHVPDDLCSLQHARIYRKDGCWTFFDLNSDRGSSINAIKVEKRDLAGGEIIKIGTTELQFTFEPPSKKAAGDSPSEPEGAQGAPQEPPTQAPSKASPVERDLCDETSTGQYQAPSLPPVRPPEPVSPHTVTRLVVIEGDSQDVGRELILSAKTPSVIGRGLSCELILTDPKVSRTHCRIDKDGEDFTITDLGSSNGTVVNGHRSQTAVIRVGDYVRLGYTVLSYQKVEERVSA